MRKRYVSFAGYSFFPMIIYSLFGVVRAKAKAGTESEWSDIECANEKK